MVTGISCNKHGNITVEECADCSECLPRPFIMTFKQPTYTNDPKVYGLREIIYCLRKAYFERIIKAVDEYVPLKELWMRKRGKYIEKIAQSGRYHELPGAYEVDVEGEKVEIRATLDCYDYKNGTLIEVKSTRVNRDKLPRRADVIQVKCYGTIFKDILAGIKVLKIVYLDFYDFLTINVDIEDMSEYLTGRVTTLHNALKRGTPPDPERSSYCTYCPCKNECTQVDLVPDEKITVQTIEG